MLNTILQMYRVQTKDNHNETLRIESKNLEVLMRC